LRESRNTRLTLEKMLAMKLKFNNVLAVIIVLLVFGYITLGSLLAWENRVTDLAAGVFLAKLGDVVYFYFRKKPTETEIEVNKTEIEVK